MEPSGHPPMTQGGARPAAAPRAAHDAYTKYRNGADRAMLYDREGMTPDEVDWCMHRFHTFGPELDGRYIPVRWDEPAIPSLAVRAARLGEDPEPLLSMCMALRVLVRHDASENGYADDVAGDDWLRGMASDDDVFLRIIRYSAAMPMAGRTDRQLQRMPSIQAVTPLLPVPGGTDGAARAEAAVLGNLATLTLMPFQALRLYVTAMDRAWSGDWFTQTTPGTYRPFLGCNDATRGIGAMLMDAARAGDTPGVVLLAALIDATGPERITDVHALRESYAAARTAMNGLIAGDRVSDARMPMEMLIEDMTETALNAIDATATDRPQS